MAAVVTVVVLVNDGEGVARLLASNEDTSSPVHIVGVPTRVPRENGC